MVPGVALALDAAAERMIAQLITVVATLQARPLPVEDEHSFLYPGIRDSGIIAIHLDHQFVLITVIRLITTIRLNHCNST